MKGNKVELSPQAIEIIAARPGKTARQLQYAIRKELGERAPLKAIEEARSGTRNELKTAMKLFKTSGAGIVREFLEKGKQGEDVSTLQAVLEHAVYVDSLRRYAADSEGLSALDIKDVIRITNDYKKLSLSRAKLEKDKGSHDSLSAVLAVKLVELVEEELSGNRELSSAFAARKPSITRRLSALVREEDVPEIELLQSLFTESGAADEA